MGNAIPPRSSKVLKEEQTIPLPSRFSPTAAPRPIRARVLRSHCPQREIDLGLQPHLSRLLLVHHVTPPPPSPPLLSLLFLIPFYRLPIGGLEFVMLARSLLRVPNRAIARQSLGKSTVRSHHPGQPIDPG